MLQIVQQKFNTDLDTDSPNCTWSMVRPFRKSADNLILCIHQKRMISTTINEFERIKHLQLMTNLLFGTELTVIITNKK